MKFERLRLSGFKTFVDPAEIAITPGLTGIVGPNGCGKSNLVEALRWVMGETSSKSLRGGGMDDVIFAGSNTRPERNHAEVTIRLGEPPADLPGHLAGADHLEIARKIVREQGSTFRMNGREVRARDVQILFADAASGARSPSMVRQGQIGEIINAKPQHRRRILEDAAGVAGLHARRHEAELRLKAAEENLTRTEDVLGHLDKQIADLRKQAKQSERYKALQAEIRNLELLSLAAGLEKAEREAAESRRDHDLAVRAIAAATAAQGEAERARAVAEHELDTLRRDAAEKNAALQRLVLAREALDGEARLTATRLREIASRREELRRDAESAASVLTDADSAAERLIAEDQALAGRIEADEAEIEADRARLAAAITARAKAETDLSAAQNAAAQALADRRGAEQRLRDAEMRHDRLVRALDEAERDLQIMESADSGLKQLESLQEEADRAQAAHGTAREAAEAAEHASHEARMAEQGLRPGVAEAEKLLQRLETEARTIRKLIDNPEPGMWTPAIDAIKVAPGYETALAAALGEDLEAAMEAGAARYWAETAPAPESLPPLPEGAEPATRHVEAPPALNARLGQIGIVAQADGARLQTALRPGQRLVSREGDLWRWDGLTGRAGTLTPAARRLAERNRLAEIEENAGIARRKRDGARGAHEAAIEAVRRTQAAEQAAREAMRRAAQAREAVNGNLQREMRRTEETRLRRESLRNRVAALAADRDEAAGLRTDAAALIETLPARDGDATTIAVLSETLSGVRRVESEAMAAEHQRAERLKSARDRRVVIAQERDAWSARTERARRMTAEQQDRAARLDAEYTRIEALPAEIAQRRRIVEGEIEVAENAGRIASDMLAAGESRMRAADEAARQTVNALADAREASARLDAHRENAAARLAEAIRAVEERIEGPVSALSAHLAAVTREEIGEPEAIEARLADLRLDRDRLGAVNLRADIELGEVEAERTRLAAEREDVIEAIRRFRRAIETLNSEGRGRLRDAFDVVNGHFQRLFERLFGGGSAELHLVEADDPLEAGLEIIAKPPGKKPQLLSLLSGGEQALTATALIFAVFLTNPAPICVLDEVDAPLDDSNVERLCDLLRDMAQETETRFLVITHNPISMARMDRLYGVTMVERGVSQLVSVDLEAAERLAEAS